MPVSVSPPTGEQAGIDDPILQSLYDFARRDPFGGLSPSSATVMGPLRHQFLKWTGRLGQYLDRLPNYVYVRADPSLQVGQAATTSALDPTGKAAALIKLPEKDIPFFDKISPASSALSDPETVQTVEKILAGPMHEGLHAAYLFRRPPARVAEEIQASHTLPSLLSPRTQKLVMENGTPDWKYTGLMRGLAPQDYLESIGKVGESYPSPLADAIIEGMARNAFRKMLSPPGR